jgi:hypothetical protein
MSFALARLAFGKIQAAILEELLVMMEAPKIAGLRENGQRRSVSTRVRPAG